MADVTVTKSFQIDDIKLHCFNSRPESLEKRQAVKTSYWPEDGRRDSAETRQETRNKKYQILENVIGSFHGNLPKVFYCC